MNTWYTLSIVFVYLLSLGVVRDCFDPSTLVLGPIDDPIIPGTKCNMRSIYDDINACLCTSNLCNLANSHNNDSREPKTRISTAKIMEIKDTINEDRNKVEGKKDIYEIKHISKYR